MAKQRKAETVDRGRLNSSSIEATASKSAQHMSDKNPRGATFGKSEAQSRRHLRAKGSVEASGTFGREE